MSDDDPITRHLSAARARFDELADEWAATWGPSVVEHVAAACPQAWQAAGEAAERVKAQEESFHAWAWESATSENGELTILRNPYERLARATEFTHASVEAGAREIRDLAP